VFSESFEEGSISGVTSRWSPGSSGSQNMTLSTDIPAGSSGTRSLRINSPSGTTGGGLYKNFAQDYDELYVRYYVKYLSGGSYHHAGGGLGGYNPMSDYLNPSAGIRPASERFSTAIEINANNRIDFYDYWVGMGCLSDGNCWGNSWPGIPDRNFCEWCLYSGNGSGVARLPVEQHKRPEVELVMAAKLRNGRIGCGIEL
jgi:hypothetical protein